MNEDRMIGQFSTKQSIMKQPSTKTIFRIKIGQM